MDVLQTDILVDMLLNFVPALEMKYLIISLPNSWFDSSCVVRIA